MTASEFPIGWATFASELRMPEGFIHFVVVDDYTSHSLWDELVPALPQIGSRPAGATWEHQHPDLPEGSWAFLHAIHNMASDGLYAKGGITKPTFEQLPAVYAIQHGQSVGHYVLNANIGIAVEFIRARLAAV